MNLNLNFIRKRLPALLLGLVLTAVFAAGFILLTMLLPTPYSMSWSGKIIPFAFCVAAGYFAVVVPIALKATAPRERLFSRD